MNAFKRPRTSLVLLAATLALTAVCTAPAGAEQPRAADPLREVLFVGNNWDGTADVVRSTGTFAKVGHVNVIPDKAQRLTEIYLNPIRLAIYLAIQQGPGEGHDQYVDDMYTTPDGRSVVVSRPSFGDVVSLDLATGKVNWRYPVSGYRSDHMALSPDGRRVVVSASLANAAYVIDIETGRQLGSFPTGAKPHENVFTHDGRYLWNMSIGEVQTNLDDPLWDWTKGDRHITVVDGATYQPVRTIDMRARLNAFGRSDLSNAVRPVAFSPDWSKLYFQVSFFNGFVEYSVATDKITRVKTLPVNPATNPDRTTWPNDSRDHGLSMSPDGAKLCVAGTVDDYATVVDRATLQEGPLVPASKPYWATLSGDGKSCVISESGANQITAIDFATGQKILSVPVGYHPQRVRLGHVAADWTGPAAG
ncbi:YncE family protein [Streptomyces sp. H39-S7]|uniref:YncE family protein n=1 Tax=Streptomyces sp. H39-S7 TaxID=3004357 RepID=UPI0022B00753|nr:YncE family protein [Streptomyces sp. H39-S7]MCZ4119695.1 YncE family protein [Streptomyces sp. H39-S7]